jgi:hypothetical protein
MSIKYSIETIGNRTRDLTDCSEVPQPLHHRVPIYKGTGRKLSIYVAVLSQQYLQKQLKDSTTSLGSLWAGHHQVKCTISEKILYKRVL